MTKTERNLYIEAQDILAPFKGEWQVRDQLLGPNGSEIITEVSKYGIIAVGKSPGSYNIYPINDGTLFWCPLPIDPKTPKRGLWGMIKEIQGLRENNNSFTCSTWDSAQDELDEINEEYSGANQHFYYGTTPTEALLRALKAQKEGK